MGAINLLPQTKLQDKFIKAKRIAFAISSLVLGVYIVAVCATMGWWLVLNLRQTQTSEEINQLTEQIKEQSNKEALVLEIDSRNQEAKKFLDSRQDVLSHVENIATGEVVIETWNYEVNVPQSLVVRSATVESIEVFVNRLKETYTQVNVSSLANDELGWSAQIEVI